MSTSKPQGPGGNGGGNGGQGGGSSNSYTRFIPREELQSFSAWAPASFEDPDVHKPAPGQSSAGGGVHKAPFSVRAGVAGAQTEGKAPAEPPAARPAARPTVGGVPHPDAVQSGGHHRQTPQSAKPARAPEPEAPPPPDIATLVREARQAGYHDGHRDGLAAMESFKQMQTAQMAAFMNDQVGGLVTDLHLRLESLEQQLSGRIAGVALELARQVVRSEIATRPEVVVAVAEDALSTLLSSARDVVLRLNPDDFAMAQGSLQGHLRTRGARVVADAHVSPGGCLVESDIAVVDASVESRWRQASAAMGVTTEWDRGVEPAATGARSLEVPEGDSGWLDDMDPPPKGKHA